VRVLVLNPGSSSLKASLIETAGEATVGVAAIDWSPEPAVTEARSEAVARTVAKVGTSGDAGPPAAVGYRVVHGGSAFREATRIDDPVVDEIKALDELAPLHNRIAVETIEATRRLLPGIPHIACFDTAFHSTLEEEAWRYPVPDEWFTRFGVRRFGFHGLSVEWAVERAAGLLGRPLPELNLVVAHLGSGSSVTAVAGGRSVDTSMGLTPLEGLMMGTRAGSLDPGILLHLLRSGMRQDELSDALEHGSGLLAVSERTADVAELERRADARDSAAKLALAIYARRAAAGIAAAATALIAIDGLVFTGGIGEHSNSMAQAICERLSPIGLDVPAGGPAGDAILSEPGAGISVLRIAAREDLVIARHTARLLSEPERPR
jgi:acetate kinase